MDADGNAQKAVPADKVVIAASNNNNILQPAKSPIIPKPETVIDGTEFMSTVHQPSRGYEVIIDAAHTIAPLEAGVGSFMTLKVLA